ncbi:MAG: molecular chaperone TorD family protein [Blastocatellia bacterium]|nr:molecular chaperone TorD family protein [Blastocatellia bacterium]MCS7156767.1 molecular chaperone TorD family protein [Blastocatellia bacterium]MCX7752725.1 molecular chaperone TorD family protein [Blastocatellia bacterium]MDW8167457.1 molecular chaperone TorD family protein [Acidobacteriota bacterium]MDW8256804.1 molecular chaperone TorD family protein [Acidobacteriota bacterium]
MKSPDKFLETEGRREDVYRLLSACYCVPGPELREPDLLDGLIASLKVVCGEAVGFAEQMKAALSQYTETDLLVDYSKLFIGPFKLLAPPYGSVYLDPDRRLMGDSTLDVIKRYQRAGVRFDPTQKDLPDHIAVELEFMSYLIWREREAYQNANFEALRQRLDDQQAFLHQHLSAWVPDFARAIKSGTNNLFYSSLADVTTTFIESDLKHVEELREKLARGTGPFAQSEAPETMDREDD